MLFLAQDIPGEVQFTAGKGNNICQFPRFILNVLTSFQKLNHKFGEFLRGPYNRSSQENFMRTLIVLTLVMSFAVHAQTRVKENIKQQTVSTSDSSSKKPVKK